MYIHISYDKSGDARVCFQTTEIEVTEKVTCIQALGHAGLDVHEIGPVWRNDKPARHSDTVCPGDIVSFVFRYDFTLRYCIVRDFGPLPLMDKPETVAQIIKRTGIDTESVAIYRRDDRNCSPDAQATESSFIHFFLAHEVDSIRFSINGRPVSVTLPKGEGLSLRDALIGYSSDDFESFDDIESIVVNGRHVYDLEREIQTLDAVIFTVSEDEVGWYEE